MNESMAGTGLDFQLTQHGGGREKGTCPADPYRLAAVAAGNGTRQAVSKVYVGRQQFFGVARLKLKQIRYLLTRNQQTDGSSLPRCSLDKPVSFERQDHLVHGRRRDSKVLLHFGLRRWAPVDLAVVVDKRQVLTLLVGIGFLHREGKDCTSKMRNRVRRVLEACHIVPYLGPKTIAVSVKRGWV